MPTHLRSLAASALLSAFTSSSSADDKIAPSRAPMGHTVFCLRYPDDCKAADAKPTKPRDKEQQLRMLQAVNSRVNAAIVPIEDNTGPADRNWFIWPKEGDCEDYALTKRHELLREGWSSSELLLAEVSLISTGKHHLVLVVRGDADMVLDNRQPDVMRFSELRKAYIWLRIESADNPKFWNRAYGALPMD